MAVMFALDLKLTFIGKHTLFRGPFAPILRWMGGVPVDRSSSHGLVGEAVRGFESVDPRVPAIAPEGTRRSVEGFRSGVVHIARGARAPVLIASLDHPAGCLRFGP